jgi:NAD(P)-dependent dehydrogenase (short-subunit alcohol dehydrogenase family)
MLEGKVAIVTGGGRGIGRAHALRLAEEGCAVVVNDLGCSIQGEGRDPEIARAVVTEIEAAGGRAIASGHDASQPAEVDALMESALAAFGKVDALVTSAAIFADAGIADLEDARFRRTIEANLGGTFLCVRAVVRHLLARRAPGRVLTTSSLAGLRGTPGLTSYSAAKAGIYGLTITTSQELRPHGITVNTLSPVAYTRVTAEPMKDLPNAAELLAPSYVADVAVFLLSDQAAEVTGQIVEVQGPQVWLSRFQQTTPVLPEGARWRPEELARRWGEITSAPRTGSTGAR